MLVRLRYTHSLTPAVAGAMLNGRRGSGALELDGRGIEQ